MNRGKEKKGSLISVIIPVYNVEEYLDACVKSVAGQTYQNLEIILVDDGSLDAGGAICDQWVQKDKRIQVIHQENAGLSAARNSGLKIAKGELIAFVDSDDVIHPMLYERLYDAMQKTESEISCCRICTDTAFETLDGYDSSYREFSPEDAILALIEDRDISVTVWNKLYTREVIGDIFFREGKYHEDEFWSYQIFARASRLVLCDFAGYGYRQRQSSIMGSRYSLKRLDLLEARSERLKFIEAHYTDLIHAARCDLRFECIRAMQLSFLYLTGDELQQSRRITGKVVKEHPIACRDYNHLPPGRKIWCFLSNITFEGTCRLRNKLHYGP